MAHGFSQKDGIDYEENFSPMDRYTSTKVILLIVAMMKWKLH